MTRSWLRMAQVYKIFGENKFTTNLDFSANAAKEMFEFESTGKGNLESSIFSNKVNGYYYGKKMLNITVAMWKEDITKGLLFIVELYQDKKFPHWWLNRIFNRKKEAIWA